VRENVAYARNATDLEISNALKAAGAWEFVSVMSDGIDTKVGDRGVCFLVDNVLGLAWPGHYSMIQTF